MTEKQRILFLFPYDWTTNPRSVREILLLKKKGYEITVVSTNVKYVFRYGMGVPSSPPLSASFKDIHNYKIPFFTAPLILPNPMLLFKICFLVFYFISAIAYSISLSFIALATCTIHKVSLIHAHNAPDLVGLVAFLVSKVARIPYVFEVHDLTPELYAETMNLPSDSIIFKMLKKIERIVVLNSNGNIFVSKAMQNHFESAYDLSRPKSIVAYSGWTRDFVNIFKYSSSELKALLRAKSLENKFIILYLGSMEDGFRRGLDNLVESIQLLVCAYKLTNAALVFVGGDDQGIAEQLFRLAKGLRISSHVFFQGRLPRREAYRWLSVADVAVVPLKKVPSFEIAVGNKTLEYMASAKAIIASDLAGHREVIRSGHSGLLFRPNDHIDLASKIFLLATTKGMIHELGLNARKEFIKSFCWEKQQTKILHLYDDVLWNRRARTCNPN